MSGVLAGYRFATECPEGLQWRLKRNCSVTPAQMGCVLVALAVVSLGVAGFFWLKGAKLVLPFALIEVVALAIAMVIFARHATDTENISLANGQLVVECELGGHVQRAVFAKDWVRVEPLENKRALIQVSGQGRTVQVGRHIRPEQRPLLAREIQRALRTRSAFSSDGGGFSPSEKNQSLV